MSSLMSTKRDGQVEVVRELEPRRDVRVVVELRAEDLVAGAGSRGRRCARARTRASSCSGRRRPRPSRSRGSGRRSRARACRAPRCGGSSRTGRSCSRSRCGSSSRPRRSPRPAPACRRGRRRRRGRAASAEKRARAAATSKRSRARLPREQLRLALRGEAGLARPLGDVAGGLGERPERQAGLDRAVDRDELEARVVGVGRRDPAGQVAPALDALLLEELLASPRRRPPRRRPASIESNVCAFGGEVALNGPLRSSSTSANHPAGEVADVDHLHGLVGRREDRAAALALGVAST